MYIYVYLFIYLYIHINSRIHCVSVCLHERLILFMASSRESHLHLDHQPDRRDPHRVPRPQHRRPTPLFFAMLEALASLLQVAQQSHSRLPAIRMCRCDDRLRLPLLHRAQLRIAHDRLSAMGGHVRLLGGHLERARLSRWIYRSSYVSVF